jgi:hypothetical protein
MDFLVLYYIFAALAVLPMARIYKRAGVTPYGVLLLAIPEAGLILSMVLLALTKWRR